MSINRDMKSYRLQKEETVRTPSGAEKQKWIDMGGQNRFQSEIGRRDKCQLDCGQRPQSCTEDS